MRILVATDQWFPDVRGGAARVATETARRLASRGHEVIVLAPRAAHAPRVETEDGLEVHRRLPRNAVPKTVSDVAWTWYWARRLRGGPFDLVLGHQTTVSVGLATAHRSVTLVVVYHASAVREARLRTEGRPPGLSRVSGRALDVLLARLEHAATRRAKRVLVLSNYSRSLVTGDHPDVADRVAVVSGGVDVDAFVPEARGTARAALGIRGDERLLVCVRRLEPQLGLETVLRAFHRLDPSEKMRLVLVGEGSFGLRLQAMAEELGICERFRLEGTRSDEMLHLWYKAADVFVLSPAPHEGFGMATIEALASGTPVVAAPVGACPELLGPLEPRLLARSAEPEDLAAAISVVSKLAGPELRDRCRGYAVSRFAWDHVVGDWERILADAAHPDS